jgi:hypothetical protein
MTIPRDYWLDHFGAYLRTERLLSDLFTVIVVAGVIGVAATFLLKRRWRWRLATIGAVVALLLLVGAAYATVGKQFRASCLRADDALAASVPIYPGARLTSKAVWTDYNNGDGPLRNFLSFTHLYPLSWNYARRLSYSLPAGTTQAQVLRFYAPHFKGWNYPHAEGHLPDFWWRGRRAVEVACFGALGEDDRVATGYELIVNGWNRPEHY